MRALAMQLAQTLAAMLLATAACAQAAPFVLISADEAQREAQAAAQRPPAAPRPRSLPPPQREAPAIEVLAPVPEGATVSSPLRLEIAFKAPPDARIVPASFRLLYGVLKIDLTERLQPHARLSEAGVLIEEAAVPQGTHRVIVRVADDKGRLAERELLIRVSATR
jgi:hypothetical protein